jgi:hypothetical protein
MFSFFSIISTPFHIYLRAPADMKGRYIHIHFGRSEMQMNSMNTIASLSASTGLLHDAAAAAE